MWDGRKDLTVDPEHRQGTPEAGTPGCQESSVLRSLNHVSFSIGGHPTWWVGFA